MSHRLGDFGSSVTARDSTPSLVLLESIRCNPHAGGAGGRGYSAPPSWSSSCRSRSWRCRSSPIRTRVRPTRNRRRTSGRRAPPPRGRWSRAHDRGHHRHRCGPRRRPRSPSGTSSSCTAPGTTRRAGIYVAICVIPEDAATKPGPWVGGVPDQEQTARGRGGTIQYAASNWINDDWAWKLFGARSYDDLAAGTFTAHTSRSAIRSGDGFDCAGRSLRGSTRATTTRHPSDRVQDLYIPVGFER